MEKRCRVCYNKSQTCKNVGVRCGARKEKVETECFVEHGALIWSKF